MIVLAGLAVAVAAATLWFGRASLDRRDVGVVIALAAGLCLALLADDSRLAWTGALAACAALGVAIRDGEAAWRLLLPRTAGLCFALFGLVRSGPVSGMLLVVGFAPLAGLLPHAGRHDLSIVPVALRPMAVIVPALLLARVAALAAGPRPGAAWLQALGLLSLAWAALARRHQPVLVPLAMAQAGVAAFGLGLGSAASAWHLGAGTVLLAAVALETSPGLLIAPLLVLAGADLSILADAVHRAPVLAGPYALALSMIAASLPRRLRLPG